MKRGFNAKPECIPCVLRQVLGILERTTQDDWLRMNILRRVMQEISESELARSSAEIAFDASRLAMHLIGESDPYRADKKHYNDLVMSLLPELRRRVVASTEPISLAAHLAVAGNIVDLGIRSEIDARGEIEMAFEKQLAIDDTELLRQTVRSAQTVLYILDNAGEVVLDRLLIEQMRRQEVTCLVRKEPIINDVTTADAHEVGLDEFCTIKDPGAPMLGVVINLANEETRKLFETADVVIAKGQANFETLCRIDREVFFLLRAKCPIIADELGVTMGDSVIYRHSPST